MGGFAARGGGRKQTVSRDASLLAAEVAAYQQAGQPVISVDTKTKELVGDFKNGGRELCPQMSRLFHDKP